MSPLQRAVQWQRRAAIWHQLAATSPDAEEAKRSQLAARRASSMARWLLGMGTRCPACGGSGLQPEDHGMGMVEYLGCTCCEATGVLPSYLRMVAP